MKTNFNFKNMTYNGVLSTIVLIVILLNIWLNIISEQTEIILLLILLLQDNFFGIEIEINTQKPSSEK